MRLPGYHVVSARRRFGRRIICEILNVLEGYPLKELGYTRRRRCTSRSRHAHAYVDRNSYLGDPIS